MGESKSRLKTKMNWVRDSEAVLKREEDYRKTAIQNPDIKPQDIKAMQEFMVVADELTRLVRSIAKVETASSENVDWVRYALTTMLLTTIFLIPNPIQLVNMSLLVNNALEKINRPPDEVKAEVGNGG